MNQIGEAGSWKAYAGKVIGSGITAGQFIFILPLGPPPSITNPLAQHFQQQARHGGGTDRFAVC